MSSPSTGSEHEQAQAGVTPSAKSGALQLALALLGSVALVAVVVFLLRPASPASAIADRMAGERWYLVAYRHRPIGHYRTRNGRTSGGDFEFRTKLRFKLGAAHETSIEERLIFHRHPPHRLLSGRHVKSSDGAVQLEVALGDRRADATIGGERRHRQVETDLELGEYLAVEQWLATARAGDATQGATVSARAVDFDSAAVVTQHWRIARVEQGGVEIAREDRAMATRVLLDHDQIPQRMTIGELFALQRVANETSARTWEQSAPLFATSPARRFRAAVDVPIADAQALRHLVLAVDYKSADLSVDAGAGADLASDVRWPGSEQSGLLTAEADSRTPVTDRERASASAASASYPADDARLLALARKAIGGHERQSEQAESLALFVHDYLRYQDSPRARTVYETLRDRRGDCTEFADFYTTLARAIGLPARTIVGLVYVADAKAFVPHAWNEVAIDEEWRSLDPTWRRTRLGATYLRLPQDWAVAALAELPRISLRVVEARY